MRRLLIPCPCHHVASWRDWSGTHEKSQARPCHPQGRFYSYTSFRTFLYGLTQNRIMVLNLPHVYIATWLAWAITHPSCGQGKVASYNETRHLKTIQPRIQPGRPQSAWPQESECPALQNILLLRQPCRPGGVAACVRQARRGQGQLNSVG